MAAHAPLERPAQVCGALLAALEAAEGRRKSRKRDQTPDAIGLSIKRTLLECAVADDPDADRFEDWLLRYVQSHETEPFRGAVSAMARVVFDEWKLARSMRAFGDWLEHGAPSDDVIVQSTRSA